MRSPSWSKRGVLVPVDLPKLALLKSSTGLFRFTRLNALNASARRFAFTLSVKEKLLPNERSVCAKPGPRNVVRPRFPSCPGNGAGNAEAGRIPVRNCDRDHPLL